MVKKFKELKKWQRVTIIVSSSVVGSVGLTAAGIESYVAIYNYINRADTSEIKPQDFVDLMPEDTIDTPSNGNNVEDDKQNQEDTNYSIEYLENFIKGQAESKLGFKIDGGLEILGVFEVNTHDQARETKNTILNILAKPEHGKIICITFDNNNAEIPIEDSRLDSDTISSFIAHLQQSSIVDVQINDEVRENIIYDNKEIQFIGKVETYTEYNGEESYLFPIFLKQDGKYVMETKKASKFDIDKFGIDPEMALTIQYGGEEDVGIHTYTNSNQQDLTFLNDLLDEHYNRVETEKEENKNEDLLPSDPFAGLTI